MKEQIDYKAICCDKLMTNMGLWPVMAHLAISEEQEDGSTIMDIGDEHYVYANRYHCSECNRYIGIAQHQAPKAKQ